MNIYDTKTVRCPACSKEIGEADYDAEIIRPKCGVPKPDPHTKTYELFSVTLDAPGACAALQVLIASMPVALANPGDRITGICQGPTNVPQAGDRLLFPDHG